MEEMIKAAEARVQVEMTARRCAMLYKSFAETLIAELGEEQGRAVIFKAIAAYGKECGKLVKERAGEMGLECTAANFSNIPDLPKLGWEAAASAVSDDELHIEITRCPLADYWIAAGVPALGRLYCYVDQAKVAAYNSELVCRHAETVLDGNSRCYVVIKKEK